MTDITHHSSATEKTQKTQKTKKNPKKWATEVAQNALRALFRRLNPCRACASPSR
jgi:hypothetical protein